MSILGEIIKSKVAESIFGAKEGGPLDFKEYVVNKGPVLVSASVRVRVFWSYIVFEVLTAKFL